MTGYQPYAPSSGTPAVQSFATRSTALTVDPLQTSLVARAIIQVYVDSDLWPVICWGPSGSGKTRFIIKVLAQVYGEWDDGRDADGNKVTYVPLEGMNWDAWKDYQRHDGGEFLELIEHIQNKGKQVPMINLDDGGRVASNQKWQSKFGQAMNDYANVQRRDVGCLCVTTPDPRWILGHIRNMPGGHTIRVNRASGNKYQRHLRYASIYEGWLSPDLKKSGVRFLWHDWFDIWLPEKVEKEWEPINQQYSRLALAEAKTQYYELMEQGKEKEAKHLKEKAEKQYGDKFTVDDPKR